MLANLDALVKRRAIVVVKSDAPRCAGVTAKLMGVNFYGSSLNAKIGFLDPDGSYSGDWTKVPVSWLELA